MKALAFIFAFVLLVSPVSAKDFKGYKCTKDCSGHKAGYAWAEKKGLTSPDQCPTKKRSFSEGCLAWVSEQSTKPPVNPSSVQGK